MFSFITKIFLLAAVVFVLPEIPFSQEFTLLDSKHLTGFTCFAQTAYEYNDSGIKYMNSRLYTKAVEAFEQALKQNPDNKTIKANLVNAYSAAGNDYAEKAMWEQAVRFTKKAYDLEKTNEILANNLSVFYSNYGYEKMKESSYPAASLNFQKALQYDRDNWGACVGLGRVAYEQGDLEKTVLYWEKAVKLNPQLEDIKEQLAKIKKENKVEDDFQEKHTNYFSVKYEGYKKEDLARKVLRILNEAYDLAGREFKYYPKQTVPVIIYTKEQFQTMTGSPDWVGGTFDGIIRINSSDIGGKEDRLKSILYHEYIHALLYRKTGNNLPVWFNEGLAQYKEPEGKVFRKEETVFLKQYMDKKQLISLAEMDQVFLNRTDKERTQLAYLQAELLVKYMDERYQFFRICLILDELAKGKNMDEALTEVLRINSASLEKNWLKWLGNVVK